MLDVWNLLSDDSAKKNYVCWKQYSKCGEMLTIIKSI